MGRSVPKGGYMNIIFLCFLALSLIFSITGGQTAKLPSAMLEGAQNGISLAISLSGPLCLWCGFHHVLQQTGLADRLTALCAFFLRRLFPDAWRDVKTRQALCGNFSANFLGLGSAATPLGIQAACSMAKGCGGIASDELCKLVVINTASVQLIPSTVAALRASLGCETPFDILPAVWITSVFSVLAGLAAAKVLAKWC